MSKNSLLYNNFIKVINFRENGEEVFVYIAYLNKARGSLKQYWSCLSIYEKIEAKKFYSTKFGELYIISHGILRYIIANYINCFPWELEFSYNAYGKPYLKNKNLQFNMSHSGNIAGYIITYNSQVGIDIEHYNNTFNMQELSKEVFTPNEQQFFDNLSLSQQVKFFYKIWTKKEAIIKAIGQGLSYPINTIDAYFAEKKTEKIIFKQEENNKIVKWHCLDLEKYNGWVGAICIEEL